MGATEIDPIAEMAEAARRLAVADQALERAIAIRAKLVLGRDAKSCFFASLGLRLVVQVDWSIDTAATDGKRLLINPDYWQALSDDAAMGVLVHEVLHCALAHFDRLDGRPINKWNIAADLAINPIVRDAGYMLPHDVLFPGRYGLAEGLTAEEYYAELQAGDPGDQDGTAGGEGLGDDPGGCGGVIAPEQGEAGQGPASGSSAADWQVAVAQASEAARQRGTMPGALSRWVGEVLQPRLPWQDILRRYLSAAARDDYSWRRPNRRFAWQGLYLPGVHSDSLGTVAVAIDTSGSIEDRTLATFGGELSAILGAYHCEAVILYCDAAIQHVQRWAPADGPLVLEPRGGGGTDHRPVFDWLADQDGVPTVLVCLTDMCSSFPAHGPEYPTIWVSTERGHTAPFGELVEI